MYSYNTKNKQILKKEEQLKNIALKMAEWREKIGCLESEEEKEELIQEINDFIDEKQISLDNIPYQLQESHIVSEQIEELQDFLEEVESEEID